MSYLIQDSPNPPQLAVCLGVNSRTRQFGHLKTEEHRPCDVGQADIEDVSNDLDALPLLGGETDQDGSRSPLAGLSVVGVKGANAAELRVVGDCLAGAWLTVPGWPRTRRSVVRPGRTTGH